MRAQSSHEPDRPPAEVGVAEYDPDILPEPSWLLAIFGAVCIAIAVAGAQAGSMFGIRPASLRVIAIVLLIIGVGAIVRQVVLTRRASRHRLAARQVLARLVVDPAASRGGSAAEAALVSAWHAVNRAEDFAAVLAGPMTRRRAPVPGLVNRADSIGDVDLYELLRGSESRLWMPAGSAAVAIEGMLLGDDVHRVVVPVVWWRTALAAALYCVAVVIFVIFVASLIPVTAGNTSMAQVRRGISGAVLYLAITKGVPWIARRVVRGPVSELGPGYLAIARPNGKSPRLLKAKRPGGAAAQPDDDLIDLDGALAILVNLRVHSFLTLTRGRVWLVMCADGRRLLLSGPSAAEMSNSLGETPQL